MKTAMQELIEAIDLITKKFKRGLSTEEILDMCNNQLDKEKEQIIDAFDYGYYCASNGTSAEITLDGKMYYNQTYNQKETRVFGESNDKQFWSDKPNKNK